MKIFCRPIHARASKFQSFLGPDGRTDIELLLRAVDEASVKSTTDKQSLAEAERFLREHWL